MKDPRDVILRPVVSEKSYALLDGNTYTFIVSPSANKTEIKEAVQAIFSVRVTNVNTLHRKEWVSAITSQLRRGGAAPPGPTSSR